MQTDPDPDPAAPAPRVAPTDPVREEAAPGASAARAPGRERDSVLEQQPPDRSPGQQPDDVPDDLPGDLPEDPPGQVFALEALGLAKSFAGVHALRGADFRVRPGEVHALMGENGAGKSTLIKVVTGVYQPDAGRVLLGGAERAFRTPLEAQGAGISTIYQEVNLVPLMSVARNLHLGREPRRFGLVDLRAMHRAAAETLARYGVRTDVTAPLHTLGLGARQMVALARAVQTEARVVIMDEPTSSLEPREVATLFSVIRDLQGQGIAVVFVSHRLDELYEICDRVTVLRDGRTVHSGPMTGLERLELVSLMLGRDVAATRGGHATAFDEARAAPAPAVSPALRARQLTARHRLHGVSVDVRPGEIVGLGGLLGAGRSETAKAVIGALPSGGSVEIAGKPLRRRSPAAALRAGVAMLAEDRKAEGIIPGLSVRENIVLAALPRLSLAGIVSTRRQDEVVKLFMDRLRIKASGPEQCVSDLSGGNQQKVLLARWLCLNPGVLLLDEPTRGIDVGAKAEVQAIIDDLARQGVAVLLISSELEELIEGSDRVVVLKDGAVAGRLDGDGVTAENLMHALAGQDVEAVADAQDVTRQDIELSVTAPRVTEPQDPDSIAPVTSAAPTSVSTPDDSASEPAPAPAPSSSSSSSSSSPSAFPAADREEPHP